MAKDKSSRKAAKEAELRRISQVGEFKSRMGGIMELPSGLRIKARNPGGLQVFITSGVIPNRLLNIIQASLKTGQKPSTEEFMDGNGEINSDLMDEMSLLLDHIALRTIVLPKIHSVPTQADVEKWNKENPDDLVDNIEDLRDDDKLYVDELPMDDKQFLFQWVTGGTKDLEEFRSQQQAGLDAMAASQSAVRAAQSAAGLSVG